jgi:hypothetical protein
VIDEGLHLDALPLGEKGYHPEHVSTPANKSSAHGHERNGEREG